MVPISWLILCSRVMENLIEDVQRYKNNEELIQIAAIGGE